MTGDPRIPCEPGALPVLNADFAMDKLALRKALRARRAAIDPAQMRNWDAHIGKQLIAWWSAQAQARATLGVYWPLPGEPDLQGAYAHMAQAGVALALPVVHERDAPLRFARWVPGEEMVKDSMGVAVPLALRWTDLPAYLIVPCLGFNAAGFRLGYGGGFYDRTLAAMPRPQTVGVAYSCQLCAFRSDAHDIALDTILTELG